MQFALKILWRCGPIVLLETKKTDTDGLHTLKIVDAPIKLTIGDHISLFNVNRFCLLFKTTYLYVSYHL